MPVVELVMTSSQIAVEIDKDGLPAAIMDPQTAGGRAFALTSHLVDTITSGDQQRTRTTLAAVRAAGEHDLGMVVWHLALSVGSRLGQLFATHAARAQTTDRPAE